MRENNLIDDRGDRQKGRSEMVNLSSEHVLMIDRGFQAYDAKPLCDAFGDVIGERARFVDENYNIYNIAGWIDLPVADGERCIRTPSVSIKVPEVMRFEKYEKKRQRKVVFSRKNLWKRDGWRCQYCGKKPPPDEITMDHVDPRANGGISCFENCVLACLRCNLQKAGRTPEQAGMRLRRLVPNGDGTVRVEFYDRPVKPSWSPIYNLPKLTKFPRTWKNFLQLKKDELYWHVELEP